MSAPKSYPKGTKFQAWSLYNETQRGVLRPVIKRWVTVPDRKPKCERLPVRQYAHFRDNPAELATFLIRLNADHKKEQDIREGVAIKHAYIDDALYDRYKRRRLKEVPSQDRISTELFHIRKHFVGFFTNRMNLMKPQEWHRIHKDEWAEYLLSNEAPKAPASKREIIQAANRFIAWLHEERPTEVPLLVFRPLSKDRFKDLIGRREIDPKVKKRTFIAPDDWQLILKNLPPELEPFVLLAYHYGARRSECLGFLPGDVKNGHLSVERALESLQPEMSFKPTKGRMKRKVPHWFATNTTAYKWVQAIQKLRIDADALTQLWRDLMDALGMVYSFHELRHSFVTRALSTGKKSRDVQLAAGHKHEKTTMGYAHDDRVSDDDEFEPDEVA